MEFREFPHACMEYLVYFPAFFVANATAIAVGFAMAFLGGLHRTPWYSVAFRGIPQSTVEFR